MPTNRRDALLALAFLVSATIVQAQGPSPGPPRAVAEPAERDLGVLAVGDAVAAEFTVRNNGASPLELRSVEAPPGVVVEGVPARVPPGGSSTVRVSLAHPPPPGPVEIGAVVKTSDPDRPELTLRVIATVRAFLLMLPGLARYVVVQHAADGVIAQTVGASDGTTFKVLSVESPNPALRATFREARPEERRPEWKGSQWRVETTLSREAPVGALSGDIVIVTDHPRQRVARAPLSGFVRPVFAVTPPEARLGDFDPRRAARVRMNVMNFAVEPIELQGVEVDVKGVRGELAAREPGRRWQLTLWVDPEKPEGAFEGRVRIRTSSAHTPVIDVPLSGRVVHGPGAP